MKRYFLIILMLLSIDAFPHEGHGEEKKPAAQTGDAYFTVNSISNVFELVLRYDSIKAGSKTTMKLFVSEFESNRPVDSATIAITSPENDQLKFVVHKLEPGIYSIEGGFPENKVYSLVLNIKGDNKADLMVLKNIEVGKELPKAEEEHSHSLINWSTILFMVGGLILGLLIAFLLRRKGSMKINSSKSL